MAEMGRLTGQAALVTGAGTGIGQACAIALAEAGARIAVNHPPGGAREAAATVGRIAEAGGEAMAVEADVSDEAAVGAMVEAVRDRFGTFDILVNNAGIQKDAPLLQMTLEQWQRVIAVNLTGQFLCARAAAREFLRSDRRKSPSCALGKIICMSSVHQAIPWPGHVNYAASKGGVMLLMKSLALELAPHGIRVVGVAPGAIKTQINRDAWQTREERQDLLHLIPYRRIGAPEDIARSVVWLASDEADYVTGTTLVADGGMMLYPGFQEGGG